MTVQELSAMLARMPASARAEIQQAINDGRPLEVQRILARVTGSGRLASEAMAALVRYWTTGR